jgi:FtsP/CotA-like multicopper oxidase with cupredoxin domain
MRSTLVGDVPCGIADQPDALAIVFYEHADKNQLPTTTSNVDTTRCANDDLSKTVPVFPMVPGPADVVSNIAINLTVNDTGHAVWTMNGQTFRANYNNPILLLAKLGNISYPEHPEWNVYNFGENKTIRIVFQNLIPFAHPMHLHGHNMFILHEGPGQWDGVTITNPNNPTRRDTQVLQPLGHMAMQITADNPGVWPFHCHIAWHLSGGLYINVMVRLPLPLFFPFLSLVVMVHLRLTRGFFF